MTKGPKHLLHVAMYMNQLAPPFWTCRHAIMLSTLQAVFQLFSGIAADTCFVLAFKPPHTAKASEIEKDNQPIINRAISSVHLFSSVFVYGLAAAQIGSDYGSSGSLRRHPWNGAEAAGYGLMVVGASLRLWCYSELGRFFTFNVGSFHLLLYYQAE
jgi:hypothetical protein